MATVLNPVDAVVVGAEWTGGIISKELVQAGLKVVALERGPYRDTVPNFQAPHIHDELKYKSHYEMEGDLSRGPVSFRNNVNQPPCRCVGTVHSARVREPEDQGSTGQGKIGAFYPGIFRTNHRP